MCVCIYLFLFIPIVKYFCDNVGMVFLEDKSR